MLSLKGFFTDSKILKPEEGLVHDVKVKHSKGGTFGFGLWFLDSRCTNLKHCVQIWITQTGNCQRTKIVTLTVRNYFSQESADWKHCKLQQKNKTQMLVWIRDKIINSNYVSLANTSVIQKFCLTVPKKYTQDFCWAFHVKCQHLAGPLGETMEIRVQFLLYLVHTFENSMIGWYSEINWMLNWDQIVSLTLPTGELHICIVPELFQWPNLFAHITIVIWVV